MYPHHAESIAKIKAHFEANQSILALLLVGSIAHDFANPTSDVDALLVLSDDDYAKRVESGQRLTLTDASLCTYPGGFVDAKYTCVAFIQRVAAIGSEPARFAFEGAQILFSRIDGLDNIIRAAAAYPVVGRQERIVRFRAQLEAWYWYCKEGRQKENAYLLHLAAAKLTLFGARLVLAQNEVLYPFHKWLARVLDGVPEKPDGIVERMQAMNEDPSEQNVEEFYQMVKGWREWDESPNGWGHQFLMDSELNWMSGTPPVDDL